MIFIVFLIITFLVYINTFQNEFNQEEIKKAEIFIYVCTVVLFITNILLSPR